jgi:predicted amidophosphoribosyltransferase
VTTAERLRLLQVETVWLWRPLMGRHEPIGVCSCCAGPMPTGGGRLCERCGGPAPSGALAGQRCEG